LPDGWLADGLTAMDVVVPIYGTGTATFANVKMGKIIIDKVALPIGSQELFEFTRSYGTNVFLADATAANESGWLVPGTYSVAELAKIGWDLTSAVASDSSPITALVLDPGETITVTFTNTQRGTIVIVKNAKGGNGTFNYSATGLGLPETFNITTTGTPNGTGSQTYANLVAGAAGGSRTITELLGSLPAGWIWTGVSVASSLGSSTVSGPSVVDPTAVVSILGAGDTVTITFENTAPLVTRTQGFWATHLKLADAVWFGGSIGGQPFAGLSEADRTFGDHVIDSDAKLMAAFWANVAKTSLGVKRGQLDQARMQLLQQLIAAMLNNAAFGSSPTGSISIAQAKTAFLTGNLGEVKAAMSAMASFNEGGDSGIFTPGVAANAKDAKYAATQASTFWDVLP